MKFNSIRTMILITSLGALLSSCSGKQEITKEIMEINQNWEFTRAGKEDFRPARVPGTVHTDLLANQMIPDPFTGTNEDSLQWIENEDWIYRSTFNISGALLKKSNIELVFEGLDTYADVYLNDSLILSADNMFIAWEAPVKKLLKEEENVLKVYFHSPVRKGMEKLAALGYPLIATNEQAPDDRKTNVFTRKAPFHYGWDWGPRLVTCGLWKPVSIRAWDEARIEDLKLSLVSLDSLLAVYSTETEIISDTESELELKFSLEGRKAVSVDLKLKPGVNKLESSLKIENPELWWTNGLGGQKLYKVTAELYSGRNILDRKEINLGVRSLELVQDPDEKGRSFYFRLNGVPVFMKGANYIPGDIFIPSVSREKYERVIGEAVEANMNMLRVWGGAVYENEVFYELCDQKGILVWQDFMFACALQPGDSLHLENIRKEAEYNVKRLRNHACIALWCGNNENLVAWHNWGWQNQYTREQNDFLWKTYENIFYRILPKAVRDFHPEVSYWPSSPQAYGDKLPDRISGDEHDWTIWFGQKDYSDYGKNTARFVSEYGLQSFPDLSTLRKFAPEEDLYTFSPLLERRQRSRMEWVAKGFNGNHMQLWYIRKYFPEPKDFESFVYLSQVNHQLSMEEAIESHRRQMPWCMGSLYWQINDCWPTVSWASVDYYGNWKAPHYQAKRSFEKLILATEKTSDSIIIFSVSDELKDRKGILEISRYNADGVLIGEKTMMDIIVRANNSTRLASFSLEKELEQFQGKTGYMALKLSEGGVLLAEKLQTYVLPREEKPGKPEFSTRIEQDDKGLLLYISSDKPARYVKLEWKGQEVKWSDNYFDLIPGSEKAIRIEGSGLDANEFKEKLRIFCLNNLL